MIALAAGILVSRIVIIVVALGIWFLTQWLLGNRGFVTNTDGGAISDGIHQLTAPWHQRLIDNPKRADGLLIASSLVIDLLGFYLLASAIFGPTIEPFLGLFLLFALRQICQAFCPLPPPVGMIWRNPGFPALLVTYGTSSDLFFSGHTAIAVYGAVYLGTHLGAIGIALGIFIAVFEITVVLILRAHYTMDVFTGAITALYVQQVAVKLAPFVDQWLSSLSLAGRG
jgi:hypothetical protein